MMKAFLIPEPFARAIFVAALALAVFALFRYRRSLDGLEQRYRWLLIALRGVALFLLSCALAGVRIEYEAATRARVLLRDTRAADARAGAATEARPPPRRWR
jgi:hypothetical protein